LERRRATTYYGEIQESDYVPDGFTVKRDDNNRDIDDDRYYFVEDDM
jgi:hypothetical protein